MKQILALLIATFLSCTAIAATSAEQVRMATRYQDMLHCMERTMGKGWQSKYDIDLITNEWGAAEPSAQDIDDAPQAIRLSDLRCRRELGLDGQRRPD